jgi:hypothetical protein
MRQMPNLRYTARGRPHRPQRRSALDENLGSRFAFAIFDLLATVLYLLMFLMNELLMWE